MPFAVCPACAAVFIVGTPGLSGGFGRCPYCCIDLELVSTERAKRETRQALDRPKPAPRPDESDSGPPGAEVREGGSPRALAA